MTSEHVRVRSILLKICVRLNLNSISVQWDRRNWKYSEVATLHPLATQHYFNQRQAWRAIAICIVFSVSGNLFDVFANSCESAFRLLKTLFLMIATPVVFSFQGSFFLLVG